MKRFTATRADRKQASKIVKEAIKEGATQSSLADKYDTFQSVISVMAQGHKVSNQVVKTVLDKEKKDEELERKDTDVY